MIKYRVIASCQEPWREQPACFLNISMGQQYHEGDKFISLLDWATRNFDCCMINIGDSIHRHNLLSVTGDKKQALEQSLKLGEDWIGRNKNFIRNYLNIPCQLNRWDHWLTHPDFAELYKNIHDYYEKDSKFRAAIEADIRKFISRVSDKTSLIRNLAEYKRSSTLYLLEECTVYILMVRNFNAVRVYPAPELQCLSYLRKKTTPEHLQGLENSIHINANFKKKKSLFIKAA
jgi:tRNA-dependent cyclodipeptide synthase